MRRKKASRTTHIKMLLLEPINVPMLPENQSFRDFWAKAILRGEQRATAGKGSESGWEKDRRGKAAGKRGRCNQPTGLRRATRQRGGNRSSCCGRLAFRSLLAPFPCPVAILHNGARMEQPCELSLCKTVCHAGQIIAYHAFDVFGFGA